MITDISFQHSFSLPHHILVSRSTFVGKNPEIKQNTHNMQDISKKIYVDTLNVPLRYYQSALPLLQYSQPQLIRTPFSLDTDILTPYIKTLA